MHVSSAGHGGKLRGRGCAHRCGLVSLLSSKDSESTWMLVVWQSLSTISDDEEAGVLSSMTMMGLKLDLLAFGILVEYSNQHQQEENYSEMWPCGICLQIPWQSPWKERLKEEKGFICSCTDSKFQTIPMRAQHRNKRKSLKWCGSGRQKPRMRLLCSHRASPPPSFPVDLRILKTSGQELFKYWPAGRSQLNPQALWNALPTSWTCSILPRGQIANKNDVEIKFPG